MDHVTTAELVLQATQALLAHAQMVAQLATEAAWAIADPATAASNSSKANPAYNASAITVDVIVKVEIAVQMAEKALATAKANS